MLAIPSIELSNGLAVTHGAVAGKRVSLGDARDVARRWGAYGFQRLHLVDLDAATGRGSNRGVLHNVIAEGTAPVQVGGGIGTAELVAQLLDEGAGWVVVGARALEDPEWLAEIAAANQGSIIVALDVRERRVHVRRSREWSSEHPRDVLDVIDELHRAQLPLGGLLVTAGDVAGQGRGANLALLEDITESSVWPVITAGTVASMGDLRALEDRGATAAVIGAALYNGGLDPGAVASEFAA